MSKEELSTGCEFSTAPLKKREGEKRHSPYNPYREKGANFAWTFGFGVRVASRKVTVA